MSYVVAGDKIVNSEDILKEIIKEFEFKEVKDLSKGSKREDTLIYKIIQEEEGLKEQLNLEEMAEDLSPEEIVEELMALADENIVFIEDVIPEGFICYGYSYHYDEGLKEVESIFVAIDENVGEKKLKEVVNRILNSVG
ncbi:hypothetical protein CACET_c00330 [Clostridium aceticum]|uniref:Uncharacterized protein n=1 Tax=Clostridium aceticum TaxID=84022 RepID=A0A0D8I5P1_9CLOT|nr:hypothetical protein [Clostridium aceticum]AKL93554.1 hypothetical protein CACET_c00330 [Clostridium aceticum]KJF25615.1 hypothetical protein TZ02_17720 [Clostridium aceticum]